MSDLIERLRDTARKGVSVWGNLQIEAADRIAELEASLLETQNVAITTALANAELVGEVARHDADSAPIPLTPSQQEALDAANRLLNFAPEFEGGDEFSILESFILARPEGEKKCPHCGGTKGTGSLMCCDKDW
jgi:hypothetical protein